MKKEFRRVLFAAAVSAALAVVSLCPFDNAQAADAVDYDSVTDPVETDFSQAAQLPLTGWFPVPLRTAAP